MVFIRGELRLADVDKGASSWGLMCHDGDFGVFKSTNPNTSFLGLILLKDSVAPKGTDIFEVFHRSVKAKMSIKFVLNVSRW